MSGNCYDPDAGTFAVLIEWFKGVATFLLILKIVPGKRYIEVSMSQAGRKKHEGRLDKIVLEFEFNDNRAKLQVPFYELSKCSSSELSELDQIAKAWKIIITEIINDKLKSTA